MPDCEKVYCAPKHAEETKKWSSLQSDGSTKEFVWCFCTKCTAWRQHQTGEHSDTQPDHQYDETVLVIVGSNCVELSTIIDSITEEDSMSEDEYF